MQHAEFEFDRQVARIVFGSLFAALECDVVFLFFERLLYRFILGFIRIQGLDFVIDGPDLQIVRILLDGRVWDSFCAIEQALVKFARFFEIIFLSVKFGDLLECFDIVGFYFYFQ